MKNFLISTIFSYFFMLGFAHAEELKPTIWKIDEQHIQSIKNWNISAFKEIFEQKNWDLANTGQYNSNDVVFISAEGNRRFREEVNFDEIQKAIDAGVTFITDNLYDRTRPYNIGERQVAAFLKKHGYFDNDSGIWKK